MHFQSEYTLRIAVVVANPLPLMTDVPSRYSDPMERGMP
jgi:hypothetical protein